jgi:predicted nucleotidyltransferase
VTYFGQVLHLLSEAGVEYIVVGGLAATMHGSVRFTDDLDIVYNRTPENLDRLAAALSPLKPYLRGVPPGLPFRFDRPTLAAGLNFTLSTALGAIDLLGEIAGGGFYNQLLPHTESIVMFGLPCRVLDLETLIATKTAAGRRKDIEAVAELNTIRERKSASA